MDRGFESWGVWKPAPKEHMGVQVDAMAEQTKFDSRGEVDGAVTALGMGSEEE